MKLMLTVEALSIKDQQSRFPLQGCEQLELTLEGVVGDVHYGFTRPADSRDTGVKRGTPVRNWRQWSAVSTEELQNIAATMGVEKVDPCMLSANITFSGVKNLTSLPRGSQIKFAGGAILTVECENAPCTLPGKEIARTYPGKKPHEFVVAAKQKRGLVGVVYRAGIIKVNDTAEVLVYESNPYRITD